MGGGVERIKNQFYATNRRKRLSTSLLYFWIDSSNPSRGTASWRENVMSEITQGNLGVNSQLAVNQVKGEYVENGENN